MYNYAQLNNENIVICISQLSGEVSDEKLILIDGLEVELGSSYDSTSKVFTPPAPTPIQPTLQEQLLAETQYHTALLETQNIGGI